MRRPEPLLRGVLLLPFIANTQRDHAQSPPLREECSKAARAHSAVRTGSSVPSLRKGLMMGSGLFC